ncbi:MAG: type II toxin-antitoxin system VapC family toxin [Chloroflexi bacterium]|nr:type II toxin-antitoxin system VapC family toxin [Chloroflexota bacterium]
MILDTSVLVAIMLDEPERDTFIARISTAHTVAVGAPTLVEAGLVLSSRMGLDASALLAHLVATMDAVVIEFGPQHWQEAVSAWWRFGEGRHAAGLNFGDCLAYAAARIAREPLLAKGDDFPKTDIPLA